MSGLVSYGMGSSDESDSSDNEESPAAASINKPQPKESHGGLHVPAPSEMTSKDPVKQTKTSLFASLPKPKASRGPSPNEISGVSSRGHAETAEVSFKGKDSGSKKTSLFSSLPPPNKNTTQATQKGIIFYLKIFDH